MCTSDGLRTRSTGSDTVDTASTISIVDSSLSKRFEVGTLKTMSLYDRSLLSQASANVKRKIDSQRCNLDIPTLFPSPHICYNSKIYFNDLKYICVKLLIKQYMEKLIDYHEKAFSGTVYTILYISTLK